MSTATLQHPATEQLKAKASEVRDGLKEIASLTPEAARENLRDARECASECVEHTRETVSKAKEGVEDFVRERPLQSILIAAGAGVLVGLLLSRK